MSRLALLLRHRIINDGHSSHPCQKSTGADRSDTAVNGCGRDGNTGLRDQPESDVRAVGRNHGLAKKQAQVLQADLVTALVTHLKQGARIRMSGLGTLEVRHRAARTGRNPATGEAIEIQASKKIAFRPAKELKAAV